MSVGGDLWPPSGATGVEDEERILRVTPLRLALLRGSAHQGVPAQVHLRVPRHLERERASERQRGRRRERWGRGAECVIKTIRSKQVKQGQKKREKKSERKHPGSIGNRKKVSGLTVG